MSHIDPSILQRFPVAGGELTVGGVPLSLLAQRVGHTPFYAYDRRLVAERVALLRRVLPKSIELHYAIKANPMPALVAFLAGGVDGMFANWNVLRWSNATNAWTRVLSNTSTYGQYSASAFDSRRNRILLVGGVGNDHATYTPASNSMQAVTFTGPQAAAMTGNGNGMVYDPQLDAFLMRSADAGGTIYRIDAQTFAVTAMAVSGATSIPAAQNGVWRRFLYVPALKGVVYVPTYSDNLWFLRTF